MSVKIHANSRIIKQTQKTSRLSRSSHKESILCLLYSLSRSDRLNCKFQGLNLMQCKMYSEHNKLTILLLIRIRQTIRSKARLVRVTSVLVGHQRAEIVFLSILSWNLIDVLLTKKINIGMRSIQDLLFWPGGLRSDTVFLTFSVL